jgi:hypothetical protein
LTITCHAWGLTMTVGTDAAVVMHPKAASRIGILHGLCKPALDHWTNVGRSNNHLEDATSMGEELEDLQCYHWREGELVDRVLDGYSYSGLTCAGQESG